MDDARTQTDPPDDRRVQEPPVDEAERGPSLAEKRTFWAEDRTLLANERTFAGWLRTGMASLAVAIGLRAVFGAFDPTWVAKLVATIFIALAVVVFWVARREACRTLGRMERHTARPLDSSRITFLATGLSVGAVAVGVVLWLL